MVENSQECSAGESGQSGAMSCRRGSRSVMAGQALALLTAAALLWSIAASLYYYPHSLSYFNELVGGPEHGHEHLLDSSIAWGQDLLYLKDWYDAHPEARPFYLAHFGFVNPRIAGIEFTLPPHGPSDPGTVTVGDAAEVGPQPGWYAIDVNYLHDSMQPAPDGRGAARVLSRHGFDLGHSLDCRPITRTGYSTYLVHVGAREASTPNVQIQR